MTELNKVYSDLASEIAIGAAANGDLKVTEFFRIFAELAAENGDCPDLTYSPVLHEAAAGYRVDGYAIEIPDGADEDASGDLHLAVCAYYQDDELPVINARDADSVVAQVERFLKSISSSRIVEQMEESSKDYLLAMQIKQYLPRIARVRILILTNAHLKTRRKAFTAREVSNLAIQVNVLDLERYEKLTTSGADPVEVRFVDDFEGPVRCLSASIGDEDVSCYLFALHGPVLASIYAAFGNRLLEQNVRTYLQAKTSVNRGILRTIAEKPSMFFAYNNGLTATASAVETERLDDGALGIVAIRDFQIVNGGQTTSSLLYARDAVKCDLGQVYVQVKLSVIEAQRLGEVVPKISEYANTQNKVSLADLASNSPVQIRIERLSKEVSTPLRAGELHGTRWFYERARGQYKNLFAYKSPAQRARLEAEYPKNQLIEKTDLAKYELAFVERPHHVSEGEQKCFQRYVTSVLAAHGDGLGLNDFWFRAAVAKAITFRALDKAIAASDWYKAAKGMKAQTVAYTISAAAHMFRKAASEMDLQRVWRDQEVPPALMAWMLSQAQRVHQILNSPPGIVKNPGEFAKKEFCWTQHVLPALGELPPELRTFGISKKEFGDEASRGRRDEKRNRELDFEIALASFVSKAAELRLLAVKKNLLSDANARALEKLQAGRLTFSKAEKNSLRTLFGRMDIEI